MASLRHPKILTYFRVRSGFGDPAAPRPWVAHDGFGLGFQSPSSEGFTLIELLIGLVLIGLLMGLVVGQMGKLTEREMKHSANRLASTIRYIYNKSASEGLTLRLVLNFEESKYWVEKTMTEGVTIAKEEEETGSRKEKEKKKKGKEEGKEERSEGIEEETTGLKSKEAVFTQEGSSLLKPVSLPKGVYFKDLFAEHQIAGLSSGEGYIYFFPQGYAERSIINLRDGDDEVHYSLEINPVSGAVAISREYKEMEIER